jgi:hypothetical protein
MKKNINNKVGNVFPPAFIIISVLFMIVGIVAIISFSFIGIFLFIIGVFMAFTSVWVEIDVEKNTYRSCTKLFGFIKSGKWKSLERYTDIAILKIKEAVEYASRSNRTTKQSKDVYNVCLLDSTHRLRIVLFKADNFTDTQEYAKRITAKLDIKLTQYNPKISEETRSRRRR